MAHVGYAPSVRVGCAQWMCSGWMEYGGAIVACGMVCMYVHGGFAESYIPLVPGVCLYLLCSLFPCTLMYWCILVRRVCIRQQWWCICCALFLFHCATMVVIGFERAVDVQHVYVLAYRVHIMCI